MLNMSNWNYHDIMTIIFTIKNVKRFAIITKIVEKVQQKLQEILELGE